MEAGMHFFPFSLVNESLKCIFTLLSNSGNSETLHTFSCMLRLVCKLESWACLDLPSAYTACALFFQIPPEGSTAG